MQKHPRIPSPQMITVPVAAKLRIEPSRTIRDWSRTDLTTAARMPDDAERETQPSARVRSSVSAIL